MVPTAFGQASQNKRTASGQAAAHMRISLLYLELRRCERCAVSLLMKIRAEAFSYEPVRYRKPGPDEGIHWCSMAYHVISITAKGWSERCPSPDTDTATDTDAAIDEDAAETVKV